MDLSQRFHEIWDRFGNSIERLAYPEKLFYGSFAANPEDEVIMQQKYTKRQWLILITLAFGYFLLGNCSALQAPFFPLEADKKGATASQYGFVFGIFQLTIFLFAPLMGKMLRYASPKFLLNSGMFAVGVTIILFGTLDMVFGSATFLTLAFLIRIFEGIGTAAAKVSCYTIIASQFSERIGNAFSIVETAYAVGLIIGPTVGGALYDLGGYGLPFWMVGCVILIDAAAIFLFLPDLDNPTIPEKGSMLKFFLHPIIMLYSLSVFTSFNYFGFNHATLEPHLRMFHLSSLELGLMFGLNGAVYALSSPVWGWLCDRKYNTLILSLLGCLIMVSSILLIGPAPFFNTGTHIWMVIVSLILLGFGAAEKIVSAFTGILQDTVKRGLPSDLSTYGHVASVVAASQSLGAFFGPTVGGYLLDTWGYKDASMALLILETVLIISLIVSICRRSICS